MARRADAAVLGGGPETSTVLRGHLRVPPIQKRGRARPRDGGGAAGRVCADAEDAEVWAGGTTWQWEGAEKDVNILLWL